jgi:alkylation response protein AidB-like acyl-CoA dehydrogenase
MMIDVMGPHGLVAPIVSTGSSAPSGGGHLGMEQSLFLFSRSDTIYGGSNEVQRNVMGERALGLPKEPNVR